MAFLKINLNDTKNTNIVFSKEEADNYKDVLYHMLSLLEDISANDVLYRKITSRLSCKVYCLLAEQDSNRFLSLYNTFSRCLQAYVIKMKKVYENIDYNYITDLMRRLSTKVSATKILNKTDKLTDLNNYMISLLSKYNINFTQ